MHGTNYGNSVVSYTSMMQSFYCLLFVVDRDYVKFKHQNNVLATYGTKLDKNQFNFGSNDS